MIESIALRKYCMKYQLKNLSVTLSFYKQQWLQYNVIQTTSTRDTKPVISIRNDDIHLLQLISGESIFIA